MQYIDNVLSTFYAGIHVALLQASEPGNVDIASYRYLNCIYSWAELEWVGFVTTDCLYAETPLLQQN